MKLYFKNILRRILGKPPVTDLYFKDKDRAASDMFSDMASRHKEVVMVCIDNSENPDFDDVRCYAKISDHSTIVEMMPVIMEKIKSQQDEQN